MVSDYQIKDSGARAEFDSGMVRDTAEDKIDFSNLFVHFEPMGTRYAIHLTKGRNKYPDPEPGVPNWTLASGGEELQRFLQSADRHYKQWRRGDTDEDHAAAVLFNINGAEYVRGKMRAAIDRPYFEPVSYETAIAAALRRKIATEAAAVRGRAFAAIRDGLAADIEGTPV